MNIFELFRLLGPMILGFAGFHFAEPFGHWWALPAVLAGIIAGGGSLVLGLVCCFCCHSKVQHDMRALFDTDAGWIDTQRSSQKQDARTWRAVTIPTSHTVSMLSRICNLKAVSDERRRWWWHVRFTLCKNEDVYCVASMDTHEYGNLATDGLEVIRRKGRLFVRYDAGSHFSEWREDEITQEEFAGIVSDGGGSNRTLLEIQRRIEHAGKDPYKSNWDPGAA